MLKSPWWALRGEERRLAKQQYEIEYPLPLTRPKAPRWLTRNGQPGFINLAGDFLPYATGTEKRIAKLLAATRDSIPGCLRIEERDGMIYFVGARGRYPAVDLTTNTIKSSLRSAVEQETEPADPVHQPKEPSR